MQERTNFGKKRYTMLLLMFWLCNFFAEAFQRNSHHNLFLVAPSCIVGYKVSSYYRTSQFTLFATSDRIQRMSKLGILSSQKQIEKSMVLVVNSTNSRQNTVIYGKGLNDGRNPTIESQAISMNNWGRNKTASSVVNILPVVQKPNAFNKRALLLDAKKQFREGNLEVAYEMFLKLIQDDKTNAFAWNGKVRVELERGETIKAKATLLEGFTHCPQNNHLQRTLAMLYVQTNRNSEAKDLLISSIHMNPRFPEYWNELAKIYISEGDMEEARSCFEDGLRNNPKSYSLMHGLGNFEFRLGNYEQAKCWLEKALQKAPSDLSFSVKISLHKVETKLKRYFAAEHTIDQAFQENPKNCLVILSKAKFHEHLGEIEQARDLFESGYLEAVKNADCYYFSQWAQFENRQLFESKKKLNSFVIRALNLQKEKKEWWNIDREHSLKPLSIKFHDFKYNNDLSIDFLNGYFTKPENQDIFLQHFFYNLTTEQLNLMKKNEVVKSLVHDIVKQIGVVRKLFQKAIVTNKMKMNRFILKLWVDFEMHHGMIDVAKRLLKSDIAKAMDISRSPGMALRLARFAAAEGKIDQARKYYRKALDTVSPLKSFPLLIGSIHLEIDCGDIEHAAFLLNEAKKRFPDNKT